MKDAPDIIDAREHVAGARAALDDKLAALAGADAALATAKAALADAPSDANADAALLADDKRRRAALLVEAHERRLAKAEVTLANVQRRADLAHAAQLAETADSWITEVLPNIERLTVLAQDVARVVHEIEAAIEKQNNAVAELDGLRERGLSVPVRDYVDADLVRTLVAVRLCGTGFTTAARAPDPVDEAFDHVIHRATDEDQRNLVLQIRAHIERLRAANAVTGPHDWVRPVAVPDWNDHSEAAQLYRAAEKILEAT